MNVLVASNDRYVKPLWTMLASLFWHETEPLDIYLIHSSVSEGNLELLRTGIHGWGGRFFPVFAGDEVFQDAPLSLHFSKEIYYRILCSELLPKTLDRVLYLDADIMIRGSLKDFYEMDFQGKSLIGIRDIPEAVGFKEQHEERMARLGLSEDDIYINSGVLLINLMKMRESFVLRDFLSRVEEYRNVLVFGDQDMINLYFKGDIGLADMGYNYPACYLDIPDFLRWLSGGWLRENPRIVHYMALPKPWQKNYYVKRMMMT